MKNRAANQFRNKLLSEGWEMPKDGFFQVSPLGEFPYYRPTGDLEEGEDADVPIIQVVDEASVAAMVEAFKADAAAPNFPGILIDYDHFSLDSDKSSRAAGWILEVQARPDGLYAKPRFTPGASQAIADGEYRLGSPVWDMAPIDGDKMRRRPIHLAGWALTNTPNITTQKPLSNKNRKEAKNMAEQAQQGAAPGFDPAAILTALGLPPETAQEDAVKAIAALVEGAAAQAAANEERKIDEAANRLGIKAANRADFAKLYKADPKAAESFANALKGSAQPAKPAANRMGNPLPASPSQETQTAANRARSTRIANRAQELLKLNPKLSYQQAFSSAEAENPEA